MVAKRLILNALAVQRRFREQFSGRVLRNSFRGGRLGSGSFQGNLADAKDDFSDQRLPCHRIDVLQQDRFEKGELLKPHGIVYEDRELLESNLIGSRVGGDRLADDVGPLPTQAYLEKFAFQAQSMGETDQDGAE